VSAREVTKKAAASRLNIKKRCPISRLGWSTGGSGQRRNIIRRLRLGGGGNQKRLKHVGLIKEGKKKDERKGRF